MALEGEASQAKSIEQHELFYAVGGALKAHHRRVSELKNNLMDCYGYHQLLYRLE
jgi:hypothetical protein